MSDLNNNSGIARGKINPPMLPYTGELIGITRRFANKIPPIMQRVQLLTLAAHFHFCSITIAQATMMITAAHTNRVSSELISDDIITLHIRVLFCTCKYNYIIAQDYPCGVIYIFSQKPTKNIYTRIDHTVKTPDLRYKL